MQHPLVNPSLAPFGFVTSRQKGRLEYIPTTATGINRERIIGRLWAKRHRLKAVHPLPIKVIVHEILPSQEKTNILKFGDFVFGELPYLSRDIIVLSGMIQWLGTNVGDCFLTTSLNGRKGYHPEREFVMKLAEEMERCHLVAHILHVCDGRCGTCLSRVGSFDGCAYDTRSISDRDMAVVDGLMRWLGKKDGRSFIRAYQAICERKYRAREEQHLKRMGWK